MPRVAQLFIQSATIFLIVGVGIGLHMGISQDHSTMPAHAHINLLGWVTSAIFGVYYALQPTKAEGRLAMVHFIVYLLGLVVMLPALYLKYAGYIEFEPMLAGGSIIVAVGVLVFAAVVFSPNDRRAGT